MNEFINVLGVRIKKSIIKKYYADEESIYVTVVYNEKDGECVDTVDVPHEGRAKVGLEILDKVFVYE
jgi:hypothetical protein